MTSEKKLALVYCQNCGEPQPVMKPIDARAKKVVDKIHPNREMLGRIDLIFRCPSCRRKIILLQQYTTTFAAAQEQVEISLKIIQVSNPSPKGGGF